MRCNMKTTQIICFWLLTIQQPFIWRGYLAFAQFFVPSTFPIYYKSKNLKNKKNGAKLVGYFLNVAVPTQFNALLAIWKIN